MLKQSIQAYKVVNQIKKAKRATSEKERSFAVKALHELFLKERGIFYKLGQTIGAAHDNSKFKELEDLTYKTESPFLIEELIEHYKDEIDFSDYSKIEESVTPGSVGQVHFAVDSNNNELALKIQYPNIKEKMLEQLSLLKLMPVAEKFTSFNKWHFPINKYRLMLNDTINKECSYQNEISNFKRFQQNISEIESAKMPKLYEKLSSNHILVCEWLNGLNINKMHNPTVKLKRAWGETLLRVFLKNLLVDGFIQADHHDGNFIFSSYPVPTTYYIDLGNCLEVPPLFSKAIIHLINDINENRETDLLTLFHYLDFDPDKLVHIQDSLGVISKIIFEPFTHDIAYDLKLWHLENKMNNAFGDNKWWFRSAGSTIFFQVLRSFLGLKNILEKLDVPIMWKRVFNEVTQGINPTLEDFPNKIKNKNLPQFNDMAKNLIINIKRGGVQKANISLPSSTIIELDEIIDKDIQQKIKSRGMEINQIIQEAVKNGLKPQILFTLDDKDSHYKVSLE